MAAAGKLWPQVFADGIKREGGPGAATPLILSRNAWAGAAAHGVTLWSSYAALDLALWSSYALDLALDLAHPPPPGWLASTAVLCGAIS